MQIIEQRRFIMKKDELYEVVNGKEVRFHEQVIDAPKPAPKPQQTKKVPSKHKEAY